MRSISVGLLAGGSLTEGSRSRLAERLRTAWSISGFAEYDITVCSHTTVHTGPLKKGISRANPRQPRRGAGRLSASLYDATRFPCLISVK